MRRSVGGIALGRVAASGALIAAFWTVPAANPDKASARPSSFAQRAANTTRERYRGPGARVLSRRSISLGFPHRGALRRSVQAVETRFLRYAGEYREAGRFWGTWELVQLLERAAYRVWQRAPGARLSIGELSARAGGRIPGHHSHQSGRDADLAFYMLDGGGRPFDPYAFAAFNARGEGLPPNRGLVFDDRRNFELVAKLVTDGDARVQFIFVANSIKRRLLRYGRARGARTVILDRLERVMVQPKTGHPHRNHFHIRIYCPPSDRPACQDRAPFHPWYPG